MPTPYSSMSQLSYSQIPSDSQDESFEQPSLDDPSLLVAQTGLLESEPESDSTPVNVVTSTNDESVLLTTTKRMKDILAAKTNYSGQCSLSNWLYFRPSLIILPGYAQGLIRKTLSRHTRTSPVLLWAPQPQDAMDNPVFCNAWHVLTGASE